MTDTPHENRDIDPRCTKECVLAKASMPCQQGACHIAREKAGSGIIDLMAALKESLRRGGTDGR